MHMMSRFRGWRKEHKKKMLKVPLKDCSLQRDIENSCDEEPGQQAADLQLISNSESEQNSTGNYMIHLKLISGHNLAVRDVTGTSDPYVKLKHGKYKARSSIINRNVNPLWMEKFIFQTKDLFIPLTLKVYDHDIVSSDDYMGEGNINLNQYGHNKVEKIILPLTDPGASNEELGYLKLEIKVLNMTYREQCAYEQQKLQQSKKKTRTQCWNSILTVTVLGAKDLPAMDSNGFSDPYCKFTLCSQRYKTKVQPKTLNPEWKEKFDMKLHDDWSRQKLYIEVWDRDFPAADDFIGECSVELSDYEPDIQHDLRLPVGKSSGVLHLHLVISGLSCKEEDTIMSETLMEKAKIDYQLHKCVRLSSVKEIGLLHITIERGADLCSNNESSLRSFVSVQVGNAQLRTHTVSYTADPIWNKTFSFPIKDIHDVIDIAVISEKSGKEDKLGQLKIPLLRVLVGHSKTYVLKDKNCLSRAQGTLTVKCDLVYNTVRAGLRTLKPREVPVLEEEPKFQRKLLLKNIQKVIDLIQPVAHIYQYIQRLLSWQDPLQSLIALMIHVGICLLAEIWMIFFLVALIFMVFYVKVFKRHDNSYLKEAYQRAALQATDSAENESDFSDLEDYAVTNDPSEHINWRQRFRQLQDILLTVQIVSGYVVDLSERIRNLLHWTVPFLCWMAILICLSVTILTYCVPMRFIILVWGLYVMTKKLWKRRQIPNIEVLDLLSRAPTDFELLQWKELIRKNT